jgi:hypothetical protein
MDENRLVRSFGEGQPAQVVDATLKLQESGNLECFLDVSAVSRRAGAAGLNEIPEKQNNRRHIGFNRKFLAHPSFQREMNSEAQGVRIWIEAVSRAPAACQKR